MKCKVCEELIYDCGNSRCEMSMVHAEYSTEYKLTGLYRRPERIRNLKV
jgi:hypothetical protein